MTPKRLAIYFLGFVVPPIILGLYLLYTTSNRILVPKRPQPLQGVSLPAKAAPKRPVALVALGRGGTQVSDLLAAAEVLGRGFDVWTAGPSRELLPTTGAVAIIADTTYLEAPKADVLVVPALLTELDGALLDWIRSRSREARVTLGLSDGAAALAQAGLLDGKAATAHPLSLGKLRAAFPSVKWEEGRSFVHDDGVVTSPGLASAASAAEAALQLALRAQLVARAQPLVEAHPPGFREFLIFFIRGGYFWGDPRLAVELKPGMDEIPLAALLDVFPRTWSAELVTVAAQRVPILTRNGLTLVPTDTTETAGLQPQPAPAVNAPSQGTAQPYQSALRTIIEGSDDRASATELVAFIQGMIALPEEFRVVQRDPSARPVLPSPRLWLRPFLLGLFGLALTFLIERRVRLE